MRLRDSANRKMQNGLLKVKLIGKVQGKVYHASKGKANKKE